MRGVERIDWRLAEDDVWDMLEDVEADIAAGESVDAERHALLRLVVAEIDEDLQAVGTSDLGVNP